jgi:hypothetical protein
MGRSGRTFARVLSMLGIVTAAGVAVLLLADWGSIQTLTFSGSTPVQATQTFRGTDIQQSFQIALIALSSTAIVLGLVSLVRPLRYPPLLLAAAMVMLADVVLIALQWTSTQLPTSVTIAQPDYVRISWGWQSSTLAAALALAGLGASALLGLTFATSVGKRCPDCAERVQRGTMDCPFCGCKFALSHHQKRCEACHLPVKADARVCRHCHHRFGEPVQPVAS